MIGADKETARSSNRFLIKLTAIATLGGLLFGYDSGVISGALLYLKDDLQLDTLQEGIVVSSLLFGAIFGALLGGKLSDVIGRRGSLMVCAGLLLFGALGSAVAPNYEFMVTARILLGLGVGAASVTVPIFLAEMAPAHRRGRIVTINELMIVTGQFLAFVTNSLLDQLIQDPQVWRWMLGVATIPAVALFAGMMLLPDSPRWYALKGRYADTRRVLELSRPSRQAAEEYDLVVEHIRREKKIDRGAALRDLKTFPWMRRLLWVGVGLAVASQVTGVNTINYFAPTILRSTGLGTSAALVLTIAVGVISIAGTLIGIYLLGRFNHRPLLLTGFYGIIGSLVTLAAAFQLPESNGRSYAVLVAMMMFMFFMQTFVGIGTWLMLSELFPIAIRGFAMGLAVLMLWTANTIISFIFPIMNAGIGSTGTFAIFVGLNIISTIFLVKFLPETKGKTLEEFEEDYAAKHGGFLGAPLRSSVTTSH
ncbi:sugar porter family MFS transporter [Arthrobacter sp. NPDC056727]|uniref:sugar porter family MFS transporter n=1 Tax=Arthrobacter sp. NPDC056727 TaxID=3345927 RepID=UPI00366B0773